MIVLVVYYDIYPIIMLLYLKIFGGGGKLKLGGGNPSAPPPLYATLVNKQPKTEDKKK